MSQTSDHVEQPYKADAKGGARLALPLLIACALLFTLFGQFLVGPPNIHSARTLVMLVESGVLVWWMTHRPDGLIWILSPLYRIVASTWIAVGFAGSFLAAHNGASALVSHLEWMAHLLFIVAVCDFLFRGSITWDEILKGISVAGFGATLFFIWKWFSLDDPASYHWTWGVAPFLNIRHTAFLFLPAFLSAFCLFAGRASRCSWFYFVCALFSFLMLFWAAGRASLAAAGAGAILAAVYYSVCVQEKKWRPGAALILIAILSMSASAFFEVNDPSLQQNWSVDVQDEDAAERFTSGRFSTWKSLMDDLSYKDWLIGQGVDNYKYVPGRADSTVHPHSWPLQAFAAWGAIGLLVIGVGTLWVLGGLVHGSLRSIIAKQKAQQFPILCVLASSLALSLFDGNFYHSWAVMINALVFALAISALLASRVQSDRDKREEAKLGSGWLYAVCFLIVGTVYQLVNNVIVFGEDSAKPKSWQAEWVLAVPFNTVFVDFWLDEWKTESPKDAVRLLKWLQANSPSKFRYFILEAQWLANEGYPEAADQLYQRAIEVAPQDARRKLLKVGPPTEQDGG